MMRVTPGPISAPRRTGVDDASCSERSARPDSPGDPSGRGRDADRLRRQPLNVLRAAGPRFAENSTFYIHTTFVLTYGTGGGEHRQLGRLRAQPAYFAELSEPEVRYSGASIGAQGASVFAGGLAPVIAHRAARRDRWLGWIAVYMSAMVLITMVAALFSPDPYRASLTKGGPVAV